MTIVVLADSVPPEQVLAALRPGEAHLDLLAFSRAGDLSTRLATALGPRVRHVLPTRDLMREAVPVSREKFVRFAAEWSARPTVFGRSFRDGFRRAGCSAWWFTELSHKNPGTRPTFARLCELEALRLVLARGSYDRALIVCSDRDQAGVLVQACAQANVAATAVPAPSRSAGPGFLKLLAGRAKRSILDSAATLLARRHRLPAAVGIGAGRRSIAFQTSFPSQWRTWRGMFRDRYYVDLPDIIRQSTPWQTFYSCVLPAPTLRTLRSNVEAAAQQARDEPGTFVFLERWASLWDVCRIYGDMRPALKYWWLESFDRRFRRSFAWDDIDIFPLVRHDLRISIVRDLPFYELLAHRARRMVAQLRPSDLVTTVETYPYGRAVAWGVQTADAPTRVVGLQHSPVNSNQLMYRFMPSEVADMPLVDLFVLHGDDAKRMLLQSGVADDRLVVTGARRFDDLIAFRRRRRDEFAELRRQWSTDGRTTIVLVATNFFPDMSRALVQTCVRALADRPDTLVLIKPHPNHRTAEDDLRVPAGARARFAVVDADLNELQAAADIMVGAYGTSDVEAIAIGCPVVRVALADFDLSPTSDEPGVMIEVSSPDELRSAIDRMAAEDARPVRADEFLERVLFRLDGRAGERMIAALSALENPIAEQTASPVQSVNTQKPDVFYHLSASDRCEVRSGGRKT